MGAFLDYFITEQYKKTDAENEFRHAQKQADYEDGRSNSGRINMLHGAIIWKDLQLTDSDTAINYIERNHKKYDPPIAVSFKDTRKKQISENEWNVWKQTSGFLDIIKKYTEISRTMKNTKGKDLTFSFGYYSVGVTPEVFNKYPDLKSKLLDIYASYLLKIDESKNEKELFAWVIGGYCSS